MRAINSFSRQPLILKLSVALAISIVLIRLSTLPHSFWHVLIIVILPAIFYRSSHLEPNQFFLNHWNNFIALNLLLFFIVLMWSSIHFFKLVKTNPPLARLPLCINMMTIVAVAFMHNLALQPNFYINLNNREKVVSMVESGELPLRPRTEFNAEPTPFIYQAKLPAEYQHLSTGFEERGEIEVVTGLENKVRMVIFPTSTGKPQKQGTYTAFVYCPDETKKKIQVQDLFGVAGLRYYLTILEARKIHPHWFWVDMFED